MKNAILFLVTILTLQSSTLVFGQNKSSFQKDLKLGQLHQIDLLSVEMMGIFRIIMEEPNLFKDYGEMPFQIDQSKDNLGITVEMFPTNNISPANGETPSSNIIAFNDFLSLQSDRYFELSYPINLANKLVDGQNSFVNNSSFQNYIGENTQSILYQPNTIIWFEIENLEQHINMAAPIPTISSSLEGWQFRAGEGGRVNF